MKILSKFKSLFEKENKDGVIVVEREDFAKEMKEKFKGNRELLKAIEECMNRRAKKHEYVKLTD